MLPLRCEHGAPRRPLRPPRRTLPPARTGTDPSHRRAPREIADFVWGGTRATPAPPPAPPHPPEPRRTRPAAQGWEEAANGFPEIPKGKRAWALWYNPAIVPLWGVIGLASVVCGGFMFKYFTGHTEVNWSKSLRMTHDNQGINEKRVATHNAHAGLRKLNKWELNIFPFHWKPVNQIVDQHRFDK